MIGHHDLADEFLRGLGTGVFSALFFLFFFTRAAHSRQRTNPLAAIIIESLADGQFAFTPPPLRTAPYLAGSLLVLFGAVLRFFLVFSLVIRRRFRQGNIWNNLFGLC